MSVACAIGANHDTSQYLRIMYQRRNKRRALSVTKLAIRAWLMVLHMVQSTRIGKSPTTVLPCTEYRIEEWYDTKHFHTKHIHK